MMSVVFSPLALAATSYGGIRVSEVRSVYDGDSFTATITGWPSIIGQRIGVRVAGIDTPEMRGKCPKEIDMARRAKQFSVAVLRSGKTIELRNMQRDKYFRILSDVIVDGKSLGQELIHAGMAVPYSGGKKRSWCTGA